MNDNHSDLKLSYRPRWISEQLVSCCEKYPVVVLTGARQVGKSTLLINEKGFYGWKYLNLDDFDILAQAEHEPLSLWKDEKRIIIDEVQKAPKLFSAIKQTVDQDRDKRFVLSGSANILLFHKVSESLAGRAIYFTLYPMTLGEINGYPLKNILIELLKGKTPSPQLLNKDMVFNPFQYMLKGFMPPLLNLTQKEDYLRWWEGYVATYLERDLRQLSQVESLPDFKRVMEAVALRSGQLINQTEIARDTKVSQSTVYRYINLLETTSLLMRIPAYAKSRTKRLIKSPKIYFIDPGLTSFLCGFYDEDILTSSREAGAIFESMVLLHLTVLCELMVPKTRIFYWRTVTGKEVDFVLEYGRRLIAIEVKCSETLTYKDTEGIRSFLEEYPEAVAGIICYPGNEIKYFGEKILTMPWTMFLGHPSSS